ncbi:hypothetical protein [Streptomyces sp. NPDC002386]
MGHDLWGKVPGFHAAPSKTTWSNAVQETNRPAKWIYTELLIHIWSNYHRIPGEKTLELLEVWSTAFRACGGDPGPRFPPRHEPHGHQVGAANPFQPLSAAPHGGYADPSPVTGDPLSQIVAAQERTIMALEEINSLKDAYNVSEKARFRAVQAGSMALALLGEARAEVAQLNRRIDSLEYASAFRPSEDQDLRRLHDRLRKAEVQESELRRQLERAERDRDKYQQIADFAARRLAFLESELQSGGGRDFSDDRKMSEVDALDDFRTDGRTPNQIDNAIEKLKEYLDQQDRVAGDTATSIGWSSAFKAEGGRVSEANEPETPAQSASAARVLALAQQTSDQAIAEARAQADRIVQDARKRAAEIEGAGGGTSDA